MSDDTVQSALVLAAACRHPTSVEDFQRDFAKRLRRWFLSIPPGIGLATVKACLRLCLGFGPSRSGVPSAGNGAAMRVAVLGALFHNDPAKRIAYVDACAKVTHTHALALQGAQLVALAAACQATGNRETFRVQAATLCPDWDDSVFGPSTGPTGYVVFSVNSALRIWTESADFTSAIEAAIALGGDTDTVAAIVGGICASNRTAPEMPDKWNRIIGWPREADLPSIRAGQSTPYLNLLTTHLLQLPVIIGYGFRRLLPPY